MPKTINKFKISGGAFKKKTSLEDRCSKHISEYSELLFGARYVHHKGIKVPAATQQQALIVYHQKNSNASALDEAKVVIGIDLNVHLVREILSTVVKLIKEAGVLPIALYSVESSVINQFYSSNEDDSNNSDSSDTLKLFHNIIHDAVTNNASDIEMDVIHNQSTNIMMTIDGVKRVRKCKFEQKKGIEIISAIIQASKTELPGVSLEGDAKMDPKDFSYIAIITGSKVLLRCNLKKAFNNKLCLSIRVSVFNPNIRAKNLVQLGYNENVSNLLSQIMMRSSGLFLITGVTGSGKTTTATSLWSNYMRTNNSRQTGFTKTLLCLDDPTETEIPGANHFEVSSSTSDAERNANAHKYIRAFLRSNPDAISIGEIRDKSMMGKTMEAARTGHICGSTMHVSSWPSVFSRIQEDFDIKSSTILLNNLMLFIITQMLVPKLCNDCCIKSAQALSSGNIKNHEINNAIRFFGNDGNDGYRYRNAIGSSDCKSCSGTGVLGRHLIYECFVFKHGNNDVIELLIRYRLAEAYKLWSNKTSNGVEGEPMGNLIYRHFKARSIDTYLAYTLLQEHMPSDKVIKEGGLNYAIS